MITYKEYNEARPEWDETVPVMVADISGYWVEVFDYGYDGGVFAVVSAADQTHGVSYEWESDAIDVRLVDDTNVQHLYADALRLGVEHAFGLLTNELVWEYRNLPEYHPLYEEE